jgi:hypothetical protein
MRPQAPLWSFQLPWSPRLAPFRAFIGWQETGQFFLPSKVKLSFNLFGAFARSKEIGLPTTKFRASRLALSEDDESLANTHPALNQAGTFLSLRITCRWITCRIFK